VTILGSFGVFHLAEEGEELTCSDITFISLSTTGLVLSAAFLITGILITRKMKKQSISENIRQKKKLELWALIFVYFVISVTSSAQDVFQLYLKITTGDCSYFEEGSWASMFGSLIQHFMNLLVPMVAILLVFNFEARRERGKSLHTLHKYRNLPETSDSSLDYEYLVGDDYQPNNSYYSVLPKSEQFSNTLVDTAPE